MAWIEGLRTRPAHDRVDAVSAPEGARAAGSASVQRVVAVAAVQDVCVSDAGTCGGLAEVRERVVTAVAEELRADTVRALRAQRPHEDVVAVAAVDHDRDRRVVQLTQVDRIVAGAAVRDDRGDAGEVLRVVGAAPELIRPHGDVAAARATDMDRLGAVRQVAL